ncbi:MAG TPA: AarF/ABC1/UbiB kinase family protein, partial [Pseudomonadales bacterium]|nr:AarF/ABC1/UbiB kinase family protein [Pseudomonadales bacterium]
AMAGMGATNRVVNIPALAKDLEQLYLQFDSDNGNNDFLNTITLQISNIGRKYGIRFPREFTLLLKQFLYFDRYIRLLSPDLDIFDDDRIFLHKA